MRKGPVGDDGKWRRGGLEGGSRAAQSQQHKAPQQRHQQAPHRAANGTHARPCAMQVLYLPVPSCPTPMPPSDA